MSQTKIHYSFLVIVSILLIPFGLFSQNEGKEFDPIDPIKHPVYLSGSFGELRSNHFHAGIDIKSSRWNQSGDPIYAVEDGYVSRINVRGGGYGNAIYIDHPGNYTSVYGHLDRFIQVFESYIKEQQYAKQSFAVNLFPETDTFTVKKGQIIGYMGNTGRSSAPHLHFEIRHTKSEKTVNPFHLGIGPKDERNPILQNLNIVHFLPDTTSVNKDRYSVEFVKKGEYRLSKDTIEVNAWRAGIEINGFDRMNGSSNKNGIYEMELKVNDKLVYHYQMDSFSFDESYHLNAHIAFMDFFHMKRRYQRCYVLPSDPLSIYKVTDSLESAVIPLYESKKQHIQLLARDFHGNTSTLEFWLKRKKDMSPPPPIVHNYMLKLDEAHLIRDDDYIIYFPDSSLYQNAYINIKQGENIEKPLLSKQLFIHANNLFKNPVDLYIKIAPEIPDSLHNKLTIVECGKDALQSQGGEIFENYLKAKIKRFGNYSIFMDSIAPSIKPIRFDPSKCKDKIIFQIEDNIENSRPLQFNGYIDDKWVLFSYDPKNKSITHKFENSLNSGEHFLKIVLIDERNNEQIYKRKFNKL